MSDRGWKSAALVGVIAAVLTALIGAASIRRASAPSLVQPNGTAELRSWIVAGRARHLYLQLICPPPVESLSGRIEYTSAALRRDYTADADVAGPPRVARMSEAADDDIVFSGPRSSANGGLPVP